MTNKTRLIVFDADDTPWRELEHFAEYKQQFTQVLCTIGHVLRIFTLRLVVI